MSRGLPLFRSKKATAWSNRTCTLGRWTGVALLSFWPIFRCALGLLGVFGAHPPSACWHPIYCDPQYLSQCPPCRSPLSSPLSYSIDVWHHLNKHNRGLRVVTNYQDDFCRRRTLTSRRAGGGTKVQKCVVVSLRGWDVEIHSSPVALEKFINQWGIWWFVQAYGRTRLARFSWRPLWGGLQQAIHKSCWSAFLYTELE